MGARASTFDHAVASGRDDADASGVDGFVQVRATRTIYGRRAADSVPLRRRVDFSYTSPRRVFRRRPATRAGVDAGDD